MIVYSKIPLKLITCSKSDDERVVWELAQLLDAHNAFIGSKGGNAATFENQNKPLIPTISERFMGMKAAIFTTNARVRSFGRNLGFTALQFDELIDDNISLNNTPQNILSSKLLKLLGFEEGKTMERGDFDLVIVHIGHGDKENELQKKILSDEVEWINALVGGFFQMPQLASEVGSRILFYLVMSYGTVSDDGDPSLSNFISQKETDSDLSSLIPLQSYTMKAGELLSDIRHHCPMLCAQWQEAVTRKDMAEVFSFNEFKERGGNLAIPADRFLYELAFKLWKAPKYGA
ncbi:PREDICTED: uncharacterized protein LOC104589224 isoform X2 [Nelumbo nucifera]|uniref:Uncharacterized protein LOC104589224 isoform X2 n=1 Tax=Nelumbo nucifera TaxID=4432 RepID=A0A1U7ZCX7_NELNU|nr:PREDICTED: uncharacterized protein LOC104589224 isoform X2 [Nelumbo nucifera]